MTYPKLDIGKLTRDQLLTILRYIEQHGPKANETCDEPGISICEAAFRELIDRRHKLFTPEWVGEVDK